MAFRPREVFGFQATAPDGRPLHRVLVTGRRVPYDQPLIVDPDSRTATVLDKERV